MNRLQYSFLVALLLIIVPATGWAQQQSSPDGVPISMVVTVEAKHGKTVPVIERPDIMAFQGKDKRTVTELVPLQGEHAGMQLVLLLDDSAGTSLDTEFGTLKSYIQNLPDQTQIAIGYMRNGTTQMAQQFTADHAAAAKALRIPMGLLGADTSSYDSLSELVKNWPSSQMRREVIMFTDGIERLGGGYPDNPYVSASIRDAQKAGVIVYTVYTTGVGHAAHSFWRENWGQNFLSQLADETGGEFYGIGFGPPVSIEPYLKEISERQQNQYRVTFLAKPENKSGLRPIRFRTEAKDIDIAAADQVYVPSGL